MKELKLYTLVIDYNGGTYVTQAMAPNRLVAPECVKELNTENTAKDLDEKDKRDVLELLKDEDFVLLDGLVNIWCGGVLIKDKFMQMNLIETCIQE